MSEPPSEQETVEQPSGEGGRQQIGPYRILQRVGEGGFGSVFEAEQDHPVRRRVALKVIKLGMDTEQVIARFEAERQALAMMDHPHIARVLDAGATEAGRPYFVMELVRGAPITEYCDRERLAIVDRLKLFAQVCSAVQHAHTKGIIHRDLKPSNVLVSTQDGQPFAKVIDFGIAKATAARLTDKVLFTELHQWVGTPVYMSPEQAAGSSDIDTRTDVYSLGVVLYELLTGTPPLGLDVLKATGPNDVERVIREIEPPRPSTRVSETTATATNIAPNRGTEPRRLVGSLRGELDCIVMKAIEKERGRRYETANGLAMDIRRYLAGEPVAAAPPSASYRLSKFVRRHRAAVAAGVLVAVTLVAGIVGTTFAMLRAEHQRKVAEKVASFMTDILRSIGPEVARGRDTTLLKDIVRQASERLEKGELEDAPDAEVELRTEIGMVETELAEHAAAERIILPAVDRARSVFGPKSIQAAQALYALGTLRLEQGRYAEADPVARECLDIRRQFLPPKDRRIAEALVNVAMASTVSGKPKEGEPLLREAVAILREVAPTDGEKLSVAIGDLAYCLRHQDRDAEAEVAYREALEVCRKLLAHPHPYTANVLNNLGVVLLHQKKFAESEAAYRESLAMGREVYGTEHPKVAPTLSGLAALAQRQGKLGEAESLLREALAITKKGLGPNHPNVGIVTGKLIDLLAAEGKRDEAERLGRELLAAYEASGSTDQAAALKKRLDTHFAASAAATK
jgi:serine/threonine protein kinase/tetratricopeptide (TPR) repeat protein